jgi:hypothetical protein
MNADAKPEMRHHFTGAITGFAGMMVLTACGPTFKQAVAIDCQGIANEMAYADCEQRLAQQWADERLGYIVRSQIIR